jgi:hypothetical protein
MLKFKGLYRTHLVASDTFLTVGITAPSRVKQGSLYLALLFWLLSDSNASNYYDNGITLRVDCLGQLEFSEYIGEIYLEGDETNIAKDIMFLWNISEQEYLSLYEGSKLAIVNGTY